MKVRGWLLIGDKHAQHQGMLMPIEHGPLHIGNLPNPMDYPAGSWIVWQPIQGLEVAVVCIEVPLY